MRRSRASSARWPASTKLSRAAARRARSRSSRPPELLRGPFRDPGRLLGRGQRGLELTFLEPLAGLVEKFLDPLVIDVGVPAQGESGIPFCGVLRFEFHEDLGGTGGAREGRDEFGLPFQPEETHPISFPEFPELPGSKPFEVEFHSTAFRLG